MIALVLAAIPPTAITGIHYFYLGWNVWGIVRCACIPLVCCTPIPYLGWMLAIVLIAAHLGWYIIDIVRIATGSLKPADGSELV